MATNLRITVPLLHPPTSARPILKWAGGKTQLLGEILPRVPRTFGAYHEPFLGSASVFFSLRPEQAFLSDTNQNLINLYVDVRDRAERLSKQIFDVQDEFNSLDEPKKATYYHERREEFNSNTRKSLRRSALMVFLNKAGFNGMYRENARGEFNIPFGKKSVLHLPSLQQLQACQAVFENSELLSTSFEGVLERAERGDFVYLDPPYIPLSSSSSFTTYQAGGFTQFDQENLAHVVGELDKRGVYFLLSNSNTPLSRALYRGFAIDTVFARRAINSKGTGRGRVAEVLVRNY